MENCQKVEETPEKASEVENIYDNGLETEEKEALRIANAMKDNLIEEKSIDSIIERTGNNAKCTYYKKNKQEVTFRLLKHQEYFITGKIISIRAEKTSNSQFILYLKLKNSKKAAYGSWEIDFETMTPSDYNPIRYFIRDSISDTLKQKIFKRDNYECMIKLEGCTETAEELDHIIPVSKGGLNVEDNLQASCSHCNKKKSANILI